MEFENSDFTREELENAINMPFNNRPFAKRLYEKYTGANTEEINYADYIDKYKSAQLMDEVVSESGKIQELTLYLEYGRTTKVVNTKLLGQGAFGLVLKDKQVNSVYKIVKLKNDADMNKNFEKLVDEMVITNILNQVMYPYTRFVGKKLQTEKVPAAPVCTNFYLVHKNATSYKEKDTLLFILEYLELSTPASTVLEETSDFVKIFTDFLFLMKGIHDAKVYYNHCDVKLDNLMYDTRKRLRFIDFGYSSLFLKTKEGEPFRVVSIECQWEDETSYMYEKDVIQLLLTSHEVYNIFFDLSSDNLVNNLLFKLSLFRKRDKLDKRFYIPRKSDSTKLKKPDVFQFSYNFKKKIRNNLKDKDENRKWANPDYLFPILTSDIYPATTTESLVQRIKKNQLLQKDISTLSPVAPKKSAKKSVRGGAPRKHRATRRRRN